MFNFLKKLKNNTKVAEQYSSESQGYCSVFAHKNQKQRGQTLIETTVAIFILVMGISTSLGLAIYTFSKADDASKAVVATGLAREGIEVVKNLRDQSLLKNSASMVTCTFQPSGAQSSCLANWAPSSISTLDTNVGNTLNYAVYLSSPSTGTYTLQQNPASYAIKYCTSGYYIPTADSCTTSGAQVYYRQLQVTLLDADPTGAVYKFTAGGSTVYAGLLDVVSTVWWKSRSCPASASPASLPASCKITVETYLTNWNNQ